jgi:hypothetical protein
MSERSYAPRSGGRTTGTRRDADARGSDARGARQFSGGTEDEPAGRADARRSGMRREEPVNRRSRATGTTAKAQDTRAKTRETDSVRAKRRTAEPAGRGRRPGLDAPVAGTAALQVDPEPLRITEPQLAPRLQVAPPAPISAPRAPFVAAMIGVVIVGVLGILLINTKTNENSFRIADLQNQESKLDNQQQDLDNQLVEISSIGNLDAAARRLGLVKADTPAMIRLPDGKLIGVLRPATGEPAVTAQDAKTDGDKGAANIVPQSGSPAEGLTPNGTPTTGAAEPAGTTPDGTAATVGAGR